MSPPPSARRYLMLVAASLGIVACAKDKARLPILVKTEFAGTPSEYIDGHINDPELFPRERALLERRERPAHERVRPMTPARAQPSGLVGRDKLDGHS